MRKITALVLALMLALSVSAFAFAEEVQDITVEVFEGPTYEYEGLGFSLTIPEVLAQVEASEEEIEAGIFDVFRTADNTATIQLLAIEFENAENMNSYFAILEESEDVKELALVKFNGTHWITYSMDGNVAMAATDINDTTLLTVIGAPSTDEGFMAVYAGVLGSIAPLE